MFKNDVERSVKEVKGVKNVKKAATAGLKLRGMNETLRRRFRSNVILWERAVDLRAGGFRLPLRAYPEIFLGFPQSFVVKAAIIR